ncbi:MAG TPA: PTS sugar transporter subunit IIA [Afipia sp.]
MKISDFLSAADVMIDVRAASKHQLLLEMSRKAAQRLGLSSEGICAELEKREQLGSTGLGGGVAIPHARIPYLERSLAVVARLKTPVDLDAIDGKPVDLVVMLLMPAPQCADHLTMLAVIARKLKVKDDVAKMRDAATASEFFEIFTANSATSC